MQVPPHSINIEIGGCGGASDADDASGDEMVVQARVEVVAKFFPSTVGPQTKASETGDNDDDKEL